MITQEQLREALTYDPITGNFTWNVREKWPKHMNSRYAGKKAGTISHGYVVICIDKKDYPAHKLAWLYETGHYPAEDTDHINHIKHDNWIKNLRIGSRSQNNENQYKPHKNNTTGYLGIQKNRNKWQARISVNKRRISLGTYETKEQAYQVYLTAKRELHGFCVI